MVATLYGIRGCYQVNEARYTRFCDKSKTPEPQSLPPTEDELLLHCRRVSYVPCLWRSALTANFDPPEPERHGWSRTENDSLIVTWMNQKPAPDSILEFFSCGCEQITWARALLMVLTVLTFALAATA